MSSFFMRGAHDVSTGDLIHVITDQGISDSRRRAGRILIRGSFLVLLLVAGAQALDALGYLDLGFRDWQPTMFAYVTWACVQIPGWRA